MSDGSNRPSYLFIGLAGETNLDLPIHSGFYRMADGANEWEALKRGLPEKPEIRALAVHPHKQEIIYAGTQAGLYRSGDRGDRWEKVPLPDHGHPVWSILFHPHDPNTILVGSDNCEIYRSDDAGESWLSLPVNVRFSDSAIGPKALPLKRILRMDAGVENPDHIYGAVEIGGVIRSTDGGLHWENLSHGMYLNDWALDLHGVAASRYRPGRVFAASRIGIFLSDDGGDHWRNIPLEPLNPKGHTYCRDIREVPGTPRSMWCAAGASFQSDIGVLLRSTDGGESWAKADMGVEIKHTMFNLAFDERKPSRMSCSTNGGDVCSSFDGGATWTAHPPPPGGTQIYAMARA
jgi:photosystem II stability/assembly factor-like uncharacterized protein